MRDDAYSEVLVGRVFAILGVKFAEMAIVPAQFSAALSGFLLGCRDPATTAADVDLTVLCTPRREWKICGISLPFGRLSLNSLVLSCPSRLSKLRCW